MKIPQFTKSAFTKWALRIAPPWSKNTSLIITGIFIGIAGIIIINPGHIVQKSLSLVGINTDIAQIPLSERTADGDQIQINQTEKEEDGTAASNADGSTKEVDESVTSTTPARSTKTGSETEITPEEIQELKDSGQPLLIAKTDWDVKVNSRYPTSCGTSSNPCPVGQQAKVNVSAYNIHTNELLPITGCNGVVNKPSAFSDAAPTTLIDNMHCEITYIPTQSGMYRLQIELYLSKSVYADTIYWGGWVWGSGSATTDGYFVQ